MSDYDVLIIGSGLGGLACGAILSREGMRCCVLERHSVLGGCLQSFRRQGHIFDTGLHFIGSMAEGQLMRQYLRHVGVWDSIDAQPLGDSSAFERIVIDGKSYPMAPTPDGFVHHLAQLFPHDADGLRRFVSLVMEVKDANSPRVLRNGKISDPDYQRFFSLSVDEAIRSHVSNPILQGVLARNALLFGGTQSDACFYHYAMVLGSNIEGPYRIMGGSQSLADALAQRIRQAGGDVFLAEGAEAIIAEGDKARAVRTSRGREITARSFISSIHPAETMRLVGPGTAIKRAYVDRLRDLPNSFGVFSTYVVFRPGAVRYDPAYATIHSSPDTWFHSGVTDHVMVCMRPAPDGLHAESATLLLPMDVADYAPWADSHLGRRPAAYEAWKDSFVEKSLRIASSFYPDFATGVQALFSASPITFRDYTGTPLGSAYGVCKNFNNPMPTIVSPRTRIANLLLTGQSLYVPGALGVMTTAAITCAQLVGEDYLSKAISQS